MDLNEATRKAKQILDEERIAPTVSYVPSTETKEVVSGLVAMAGYLNLPQIRLQRPRTVVENGKLFKFDSTNHGLLCALLSQLSIGEHKSFVAYIATRLHWGVGCSKKPYGPNYPKWCGLVSELPLVVEFLVRNGGKAQLFETLANEETKSIPGHMLMLLQLEDLISLNFLQFTDAEYEQLSSAVAGFGKRAEEKAAEYQRSNIQTMKWPDIGETGSWGLYRDIAASCSGIVEECRKARYFYLKGALQEGLNLEVNQDKTAVEAYLHQFGFAPSLVDTLNEAERLYRLQGTLFDSKNSLGHLRSFLENVQKQAMPKIHARYGGDPPLEWGAGLAYLARNAILSKAEEQLAVSLYRLISDEGVHPLIAQREYVRLARNMVIEYSLLFLKKIEKLGLLRVV
jgi:hypothetical protein